MSFSYIKSINFSNLDNERIFLNHLIDDTNLIENKQYKIDIVKNKKFEIINSYKINVQKNGIEQSDSLYPEKGLLIELSSGTYKMIYSGGILKNSVTNEFKNIILKSSKGEIKLDSFKSNDDNLILDKKNQFEFKISKNEKFSVWIESNDIDSLEGEIEFIIIKMSNLKINSQNLIENSILFDMNTINDIIIQFEQVLDYSLEIYQLDEIELHTPNFKYPDGTYKITLNTNLASSLKEQELMTITTLDKQKFSLINGKISNFTNILIPDNVNPINYYNMIGKLEYLIYLNFMTDSYYFCPCGPVECFMSLYIPESKCEIIEDNTSYAIFKVTSYQFISNSYKKQDEIYKNISKWIEIPKDNINVDQYGLFYWAYVENNQIDLFYTDSRKYINIDNFFIYVYFSLTGSIFDNVSEPFNKELNEDFENNQYGIGFKFTDCTYTIIPPTNYINAIEWGTPTEWENYKDTPNILTASISGSGVYKISKLRFKLLTGIDPETNKDGKVNLEKINDINFNRPDVEPFNRFQYWLKTSKF